MIEIKKTDTYLKWFKSLKDKKTQAVIDMHIGRMYFGNFGNSKPIGHGLSELKINYKREFSLSFTFENLL